MSTPQLPQPPGKKMVYYCHDGETVHGPETFDDVFLKVIEGTLTNEISVLLEGTEGWIPFRQVPDSWSSPRVVALARAKAQELNLQADQVAQVKETERQIGGGCAAVFILICFCIGLYCFLAWLGSPH
jgi:hypothetical protein